MLTPTWQPARNARHRITGAAIYELPFGKGRALMNSGNPILDGIFGGWSLSGLFTYNTGLYLRFGGSAGGWRSWYRQSDNESVVRYLEVQATARVYTARESAAV